MFHKVKNLARVSANYIDVSVQRFRKSGFRSGWTSLKTNALNYGVRLGNAWLPPRYECPCCGWRGWRFRNLDCGKFMVPNVECPWCRGHERHRIMHLYLTRRPPAFMAGTGRVLHFAPERQVHAFVSKNPNLKYIAFDIDMSQYTLRPGANADLHHLPIKDAAADGLFCMHVLEHVRSDHECLRELHRILKPGAEAVIMVPFMMHQTETEEYGKPDPEIFDHVRGYSPLDFKHRLAPFEYEEIFPHTFLTPEETQRFAIPDSQAIYRCTKR